MIEDQAKELKTELGLGPLRILNFSLVNNNKSRNEIERKKNKNKKKHKQGRRQGA